MVEKKQLSDQVNGNKRFKSNTSSLVQFFSVETITHMLKTHAYSEVESRILFIRPYTLSFIKQRRLSISHDYTSLDYLIYTHGLL